MIPEGRIVSVEVNNFRYNLDKEFKHLGTLRQINFDHKAYHKWGDKVIHLIFENAEGLLYEGRVICNEKFMVTLDSKIGE